MAFENAFRLPTPDDKTSGVTFFLNRSFRLKKMKISRGPITGTLKIKKTVVEIPLPRNANVQYN